MKHKEWLIRLNFPPKYIETSRQVLILYWVFVQHTLSLAPQHASTRYQVSRTKARKAFLDPPGALCLFPNSALGWLNEESSEEQATVCDISIWTARQLLQSLCYILPATQKQTLHLVACPSWGHFATQQECRKRCLQNSEFWSRDNKNNLIVTLVL